MVHVTWVHMICTWEVVDIMPYRIISDYHTVLRKIHFLGGFGVSLPVLHRVQLREPCDPCYLRSSLA